MRSIITTLLLMGTLLTRRASLSSASIIHEQPTKR